MILCVHPEKILSEMAEQEETRTLVGSGFLSPAVVSGVKISSADDFFRGRKNRRRRAYTCVTCARN